MELNKKFKLIYYKFLNPQRYVFYGFRDDIDATVDELNEVDDFIDLYKTDLFKEYNPFANAKVRIRKK